MDMQLTNIMITVKQIIMIIQVREFKTDRI
jgi:hypothetical protein